MKSQNTSTGAVICALLTTISAIDVLPPDMISVRMTPRSITPPAANV